MRNFVEGRQSCPVAEDECRALLPFLSGRTVAALKRSQMRYGQNTGGETGKSREAEFMLQYRNSGQMRRKGDW